MNDITVTVSGQAVVAHWTKDHRMASASMTNMGDCWYINRVFVPEGMRGCGIGSKLLMAAIKHATSSGPKRVIVTPGGYGTPVRKQNRFYTNNGFKKVERGLYEWTCEGT